MLIREGILLEFESDLKAQRTYFLLTLYSALFAFRLVVFLIRLRSTAVRFNSLPDSRCCVSFSCNSNYEKSKSVYASTM